MAFLMLFNALLWTTNHTSHSLLPLTTFASTTERPVT
jgi:hypothetical protein